MAAPFSFPLPADAVPRPALDALERELVGATLAPLPSGQHGGRFLGWVDARGARRRRVRVVDTILFRALRWGLDLDARRWWFEHPALAVGHFRIEEGPSRWRPTRVLQLHYEGSRLPIAHMLYDELLPLSDGRVLGIGGLNAPRGEGDHFLFALEPMAPVR